MAERLVNIFFQKSFFIKLGDEIKKHHPSFNTKQFLEHIYTSDFESLTLKERMHKAAAALRKNLPADYKQAVEILKKVEPLFEGFEHILFADFVEQYGLEDYETSIEALEIFTRSTAEFAIRPFLIKYPQTIKQMVKWSKHEKDYVRRLASEGTRPRLPWGQALPAFKKDPSPILPILENLKNDPSETVRRSVANNLNDISKDNPEVVLAIATKWIGTSPETDELLKHALRGLLKKGDRQAMRLFNYHDAEGISVKNLMVEPAQIHIGHTGFVSFEIILAGTKEKKLRIEYQIVYARSNGKTGNKIFQVEESKFKAGSKQYKRKLNFFNMTTRKHYAGKHTLTIIVNGHPLQSVDFYLI